MAPGYELAGREGPGAIPGLHRASLVPEIRRVLATDDAMWKYWVVQELVAPHAGVMAALRPELGALAEIEPRDEDDACFVEMVREALATSQPSGK